MADIRCPMCSQANPEEAEVCAFCSARLRPLLAGGPAEGTPPSEPEPEETDWLSRIRQEAVRGQAEPTPPAPEEGGPDWLSRLRRAEAEEEGPPKGEVPAWVSDAVEPAAPQPAAPAEPEVPNWLARVRERKAAEGEPAEESAPEPEEDWLSRLRVPQEGQVPPREAPPLPEILRPPDEGTPAVKLPPTSLPSWLPQPPVEEEAAEESPALPSTPWEPPSRPIAVPFSRGKAAPPPETPAPAWPSEPETPAPAWPPVPATPASAWPPTAESPSIAAPPSRAEAAPEPPAFVEPAGPEGPQHTPALLPEEGLPFVPGEAADFDIDSIKLPEWLSEAKPAAAQPKPPAEEQGANLAPATLPAWLEAMRPMETFRPVVEIQPEEEQLVEAAGPLAGLRGVLLAEPVVAIPRQRDVGSARLDVTERQYAHAEFLHRMVQEEERELPPAVAGRRRIPLVRWVLSFVLLLGVALPMMAGLPAFALPVLGPPDLNPFIGRINALPVERPALLVIDYEPGYSGELEAVAGPMLDHMISRGLRIATVSTRPSGPPLAERLLVRAGVAVGYQNGRDYLHLGFLPGGPAAVQLFAEDPRQAVPHGYLLPAELTSRSGWESSMLSGVTALSDFGAVILITSGAETARTWIEQASPRLGEVPLLMVLSAGVEPMVRPYYETLNPQVDAILAGLPAAAAYENANGRPGGAQSIWGGFGSGLFVAELSLALGAGYGLLTALLARRRA